VFKAETVEEASGWVQSVRRLLSEQRVGPGRMPLLVRMRQLAAQYDNNSEPIAAVLAREYGEDGANVYAADIAGALRKEASYEGASLSSVHSSLSVASQFGDDDEEEVLPGEGVWLTKKGEGGLSFLSEKKRYFVLRWGLQSQRLKFVYFEQFKDNVPQKKKGAIVLTPASIVTATAKALTIVRLVCFHNYCQ
jgi:hypothetical protein